MRGGEQIVAQRGEFFGAGVVPHLLKEGTRLRRQRAGRGETGQVGRPRQQIVWPRSGPRRSEIVHRLFSLNGYLGVRASRRHVGVVNCGGRVGGVGAGGQDQFTTRPPTSMQYQEQEPCRRAGLSSGRSGIAGCS